MPLIRFSGSRSLDESSGEVGPSLAEYLRLPQITSITAIDSTAHEDKIVVERRIERVRRAKPECPVPTVLAVGFAQWENGNIEGLWIYSLLLVRNRATKWLWCSQGKE